MRLTHQVFHIPLLLIQTSGIWKLKATQLKSMVVENNCKFIRKLTGMKNLWDLSKISGSEKKLEKYITQSMLSEKIITLLT